VERRVQHFRETDTAYKIAKIYEEAVQTFLSRRRAHGFLYVTDDTPVDKVVGELMEATMDQAARSQTEQVLCLLREMQRAAIQHMTLYAPLAAATLSTLDSALEQLPRYGAKGEDVLPFLERLKSTIKRVKKHGYERREAEDWLPVVTELYTLRDALSQLREDDDD